MGGSNDVVSYSVKVIMVITLSLALFFLANQQTDLFLNRPVSQNEVLTIKFNFDDEFHADKRKYFAVVMIPTTPNHISIRNIIRGSWGNVSAWKVGMDNLDAEYKSIKLMWVIGALKDQEYPEEFKEEISKNNDIYICDKIDEHRTVLKYKVLWSYMRAVQLFDFKYFVKTDDDILVNLPLLLSHLKDSPRSHYYGGRCGMGYGGFGGYPKWRYCSGGGYYMSKDVVEHAISLPPQYHRVPFRPEDAYSGYLVHMAIKTQNFSVTIATNKKALSLSGYKCGPWEYFFYHHEFHKMQEDFNMITVNKTVKCV